MKTAEWRLLSAAEAAERLNVPVKVVYSLIAQGALRSVRIGRLHKFTPSELDRFVQEAMAR